MIELALALCRLRFGMQWSDDLLKASAVFIGAGLFIFVFFSVQLFLIYQLEKGHLLRRHQRQPGLNKDEPSPVDAAMEQQHE
jgi:hypothetical protein